MAMACVISGCVSGRAQDTDNPDPGVRVDARGVVTRIVDGDSIEVDLTGEITEVRLVAVNTPDQGECFADRAREHLDESLLDRTVQLEIMGEDQFGRTLAHVFDGERHVNVELIEKGLALASTPGEDDPNATAILTAEDGAYGSKTGLWSPDACGPDRPPPGVAIDTDRSAVDPPGRDEDNLEGETIAIFNGTTETIDLTGWLLRDESTRHRFSFPRSVILGPGESLAVASSDTGWVPGDSPVWNNDGDMALLQLPDGTVVSRWRY